ncbi:ABC transporter permease [Clostridium gasigenes]|uniref:ABC transporter permease n=1 Tax=Clostridium gasigenes TaxID=94869 RepID=UPI0016293AC2|nr:ABC transporter permease [Clostridium gasigenes]MBB6625279.1 ABC transporter permease [Clostridium gasigenes]MBU3089891.1 ABC transporter permease [Clostridium gasigenes]
MILKPHIKKNMLLFIRESRIHLITFIIFPMVMAFIYGNMQKDMFDGKDHKIKPINVKFNYSEEVAEGKIFAQVINGEEIKDIIVVDDDATDYEVSINDDFSKVEIKAKNENDMETTILKSFMISFTDNLNKYKLIGNIIDNSSLNSMEMQNIQGEIVNSINDLNKKPGVKESIIEGYKTIGAREYYTISMFSFTSFLLIITLTKGFYKDKKDGIVKRTLASPCEKKEYFIGFLISVAASILIIATLFIIINRSLGFAFLGNPIMLMLIVASQSILGASFASMIIAFFKEEKIANMVMNAFIFITTLLGGVFFNIDLIEIKWFKFICNLSPNSLLLNSFKSFAISNEFESIKNEVTIMIVLAVVLIVVAYKKISYKWEV